jgi:U3 small nucleolar ribonucleoprotein component
VSSTKKETANTAITVGFHTILQLQLLSNPPTAEIAMEIRVETTTTTMEEIMETMVIMETTEVATLQIATTHRMSPTKKDGERRTRNIIRM